MPTVKQAVCRLPILLIMASLGATNSQKIFPLDNSIYRYITHLYILQGKALPSTTAPFSQDELRRMFDKIDRTALATPVEFELYDQVATCLVEKPKQIG